MKLKAIQMEHRPQTEVRPQTLLDQNFKYVRSEATDVTQTWKKFGWTPIENKEKHYEPK